MKDLAQITQEFNNKEVLYEPITYNNVHNIWTFGLNSSTDGTLQLHIETLELCRKRNNIMEAEVQKQTALRKKKWKEKWIRRHNNKSRALIE